MEQICVFIVYNSIIKKVKVSKMKRRKLTALLLTVLFAAATFTSCATGKNEVDNSGSFDYFYSESLTDSAPMEMESGSLGAYDTNKSYDYKAETEITADSNTQSDLANRKIIKTARLTFQTEIYDDFITNLRNIIASHGGYIESSEMYGGDIYAAHNDRSSYIKVRVPQSSYDVFMSTICDMGTLTYRSEGSEDVTMSYVDIESHIRALESEYAALLEILDKATSLDDVIQLQSRISEVNYRLDSYKSQIRKYDDLISYCTVNITVQEVYRTVAIESKMTFGEKIANGLEKTFLDITDDASEFTIWFVTSLPYLLIWAVIIVLVIIVIKLIIKSVKKKTEEKKVNNILKQINENQNKN